MREIESILNYFPQKIQQILIAKIESDETIERNIHEIRIRAEKPIILRLNNRDIILNYRVLQSEILEIVERLCENSIYAYKNEICEGFITIKGGHRIGLTGSCVIENGKIINIKYISSLNFRIAREVIGCATALLNKIVDMPKMTIYNSVIVAPPGHGKTTVLRDIIRQLSNGIEELNFKGKVCGVVDERGEIAAMYRGIPQNDVGIRTDVIENVSKNCGIHMLVRSMAPEIIVCDEIGSVEDVEAIKYAMVSGAKGLFTMHGFNMEDVKNNKEVSSLIEGKIIERVIFL